MTQYTSLAEYLASIDLWFLLTIYIPALVPLIIIVAIHVLLSTVAHIKMKDFSFKKWPQYIKNFIWFLGMLIITNLIVQSISVEMNNHYIDYIAMGIQGLVYVQVFGYYADNILANAQELGFPVSPDLAVAVSSITSQVKRMFQGS